MGLLALSQLTSRGSAVPPIYIGQALSPYLFAAMVPVALVALVRGELVLGVTSAAVALPLLVLSSTLVSPPELPAAAPGAPHVTILSANVLYENHHVGEAVRALLDANADVLIVSELTAEIDDAFTAAGVDDLYPHRAGTPDTWVRGLALWSRHPLLRSELLSIVGRTTVEAVIDVDGTPIRVIGAHPPQPISRAGRHDWRPALDQLADAALRRTSLDTMTGVPTVLVGDMNASFWHPPFRELLDRGLVDAHIGLGHGWSTSWPDDLPLLPPFVRIDHALLGEGITATDIRDLAVPGSDHRAFIVTVTPAATGATEGAGS